MAQTTEQPDNNGIANVGVEDCRDGNPEKRLDMRVLDFIYYEMLKTAGFP